MTDPNDVTDQFDTSSIPVPPLKDFVLALDAMKSAEKKTYLGKLTEGEAKQTLRKTIVLTGLTDLIVSLIVDETNSGYTVKSDFYRHAVEMLISYYIENNMISLGEQQGFVLDGMNKQHELRLDAERARIRNEFRDNITMMDDELDSSRMIGDYEHIAHRLTKYRQMLRTCESETQRRLLREVLANSVATKSAVIAFYSWTHSQYRTPVDNWDDEWVELSENWSRFYEDMQ